MKGQTPRADDKCKCQRCGKWLKSTNFYTYKDGSKCQLCKPCLTAHIDNFDSSTYEWILEKMDVPFIPAEWNTLRDRAFAKNPYKMNGLSVIGKYLGKMKLKQWNDKTYADTEKILQEMQEQEEEKNEAKEKEKKQYQAQLKVKLSEGKISEAQYKTLTSTETQQEELPEMAGNLRTGLPGLMTNKNFTNYEEALSFVKNPYLEQNFISEDELIDPGKDLNQQDKIYLALKWGRLYRPAQWIALQQLYNQFMQSFDIQGAARVDTLKMICKTSLKMNQAIDSGDIDTYQKLSRVYDAMMKSAKFTEAQNKDDSVDSIDSASAIVDFVESKSGQIPRLILDQPQDLIDKIIQDLKEYNRNLIYEDKSLAQEIEKYLQDKRNSEEIKNNKKTSLEDEDIIAYKKALAEMQQYDENLDEESLQKEYKQRRVNKQT